MISQVSLLAYGKDDIRTVHPSDKVTSLPFNFDRPVINKNTNTIQKQTINVNAPLLSLINIPALLIDSVEVDFSMEVKDIISNKKSTTEKAKASGSFNAWYSPVSVTLSASVSTQRENTRITDKSARYHVNVKASQQPQVEGMSKLVELLSSSIEPLDVSSTGSN